MYKGVSSLLKKLTTSIICRYWILKQLNHLVCMA